VKLGFSVGSPTQTAFPIPPLCTAESNIFDK
jgi:hypothetical protein